MNDSFERFQVGGVRDIELMEQVLERICLADKLHCRLSANRRSSSKNERRPGRIQPVNQCNDGVILFKRGTLRMGQECRRLACLGMYVEDRQITFSWTRGLSLENELVRAGYFGQSEV